MEQIQVTLPCHPTMLRVFRSLANRAADLAGLGYDRLVDLGLAVDEVGAELIATGGSAPLQAEVSHATGEVIFRMAMAAQVPVWPADGWSESIGGLVLDSVADSVTFQLDDGRPSAEIVVSAHHD